ncbi:hypothetical protein QBC39DRAFT_341819 [Podospora conica]|nr:hypothetical protein QBC39DRAFT_341819 [Schizothecium conicum]
MACRQPLAPVLRRLTKTASSELGRQSSRSQALHRTTVRCLSTSQPRPLRQTPARRTAQPKDEFTSNKYPEIQRDERFARLTPDHVAHFRRLLGDNAVIDGVTAPSASVSDDLAPFNSDWMRKYRGHTQLVLKPATTAEVSQVLAYCNEHLLAVVPQGGNTGLVGGSVPVFDEIVLSLSRMNKIISFDPVSGVLVAEAGVILETADAHLASAPHPHIFPLDLGAKGSCQLGGNLSTNAGGLRLLRYGSLHGTVLGLEAVLPSGQVIDDLCTLRKNNTGYDLKHLFIGAEGTLGAITKLAVHCPRRPAAQNVALLGLPSYAHCQRAFSAAKSHLSEILSAFELMDAGSQALVNLVTGNAHPLADPHPFYCLVETSGSNAEHDADKLSAFLESVLESEIVSDGTLAADETQARTLWAWREGITEALGHLGGVYKYDVSIPLADMYALVEATRARVAEAGLIGDGDEFPVRAVVGYGHMGDANLHLNVATRRFDDRVEGVLEPFVYEWIQERQGSISAEHGLGLAKKKYIGYSRNDTMVGLMKQIKGLYDPKGIMNPYKYI